MKVCSVIYCMIIPNERFIIYSKSLGGLNFRVFTSVLYSIKAFINVKDYIS